LHLSAELVQASTVAGDRVVVEPTTDHRTQPWANLDYRIVHALPQPLLDLLQLGPHALGNRFSFDRERSLPGRSAIVREAQEVERLRFAQASPGSAFGRVATELDESGFVRV